MMRLKVFILFLICSLSALATVPVDEGAARRWCDVSPLSRIEGIWEFPADGTRVLIHRSAGNTSVYAISILSTPDCRLTPGEEIGRLAESGEPNKMKLSLCRKREMGILADPAHCMAKVSSDFSSIAIKARKFKIRLGSLWFLPKVWRAIRISVSDPAGELSDGLVKIYPRPSTHSASDPVYL